MDCIKENCHTKSAWQSIALILDIYPVYLTGGISKEVLFLCKNYEKGEEINY